MRSDYILEKTSLLSEPSTSSSQLIPHGNIYDLCRFSIPTLPMHKWLNTGVCIVAASIVCHTIPHKITVVKYPGLLKISQNYVGNLVVKNWFVTCTTLPPKALSQSIVKTSLKAKNAGLNLSVNDSKDHQMLMKRKAKCPNLLVHSSKALYNAGAVPQCCTLKIVS